MTLHQIQSPLKDRIGIMLYSKLHLMSCYHLTHYDDSICIRICTVMCA